jgi:hypothetical protein
MATLFGIDTAIGWAQWTLKGGWPRVRRDLSLGALVVGVCLIGSLRFGEATTTVLSTWRMILMIAQALLLVLVACARITNGMRLDATTRMIESHWLMPVPGAVVINGYIWGSVAHVLILAAANFLLGAVVSVGAGLSVMSWVMPNLVLLVFSVFCWCSAALGAAFSSNAAGVMTTIGFIFAFSRGAATALLPGVVVLVSPLAGNSIFQSRPTGWEITPSMASAMAAQLYMAVICYWAAVRKYTIPYQPAFGVLPGLMLLAGWIVISYIGIADWEHIRPAVLGSAEQEDWILLVSSLLAAMLLALVPIRNVSLLGPYAKPMKALGVTLAAAALILYLPLVFRRSSVEFTYAWAMTAAVVVSFLLLFGQLMRWPRLPLLIGFTILFITWVAPMVIDYALYLQAQRTRNYLMGEISSFSPIGALIMIWTRNDAVQRGIIAQALAGLAAVAIGLLNTHRRYIPPLSSAAEVN